MIPALLLTLLAQTSTPSGSATVALSELLPLLNPAPAEAGPQSGWVSELKLTGRPGESGLWVEGSVTVTARRVVTPLRLPILVVGAQGAVESLAADGTAALELRQGVLSVVCLQDGQATLPLKVFLRATRAGAMRRVTLAPGSAAPLTPLRLDVDDALFQLEGASQVAEWGGWVVFPQGGRYALGWAPRRAVEPTQVVRRAPVEPKVTLASSRWTSTLEGRATHEVLLAVELDAPTTLEVTLPPGQVLVGAKVNGLVATAAPGEGTVKLLVRPGTLGSTAGTVELKLVEDFGVFNLSGRLELKAPRLSWPVARWVMEAVLPEVFTYLRDGGSMAQLPEPGALALPASTVPGRTLQFQQHLVAASAPLVALAYSVDLEQQYFR